MTKFHRGTGRAILPPEQPVNHSEQGRWSVKKGTLKLWTALTIMVAGIALVASFDRPASAFQPFLTSAKTYYTWPVAKGAIKWNVAPDAPAIVRESMQAVAQAWSEATAGEVKFEEGIGGIQVEWDADGSKIVDTLYLAYTTFNADVDNHIISSKVIINALSYTWHRGGNTGVGPVVNGKRDSNLDSVLMHEIGHALGLDHSDRNAASIVGTWSASDLPTMNSVIYPGADSLHSDDDAGITTLYPSGAASAPSLGVSASPLTGRGPLTVSFNTLDGSLALWDFGNGTQGSGAETTHKFTTPGVYTVTCTANGTSTTVQIEVTKKGKKAKAPKPVKVKKQKN
jgi:PKD repeat protein